MTGQRAGWLVTKCQMDTTNCLNDLSFICNWPQLWLSSLALPAVLRSGVGSLLGIHPGGSVQALVSMTVPEGAVCLLVMPSSNKFCLIHGVKRPWHHFIPPSFTFFFFCFSPHFHVSCCDQSQRHFLILVQDCWYFPPYAILTLVSRAIVKMPLCAQNRCL